MCNESPDQSRARQRARPESSAPDFREGTIPSFPAPHSFFRQSVPGDGAVVPKRWAGGGGVYVPTPFVPPRAVRRSQTHLRSDPSSINSQLIRRPRWSDIKERAGLSTRSCSIATCTENGRASDRGAPAKTQSVRV